jgi:hypothetical protein
MAWAGCKQIGLHSGWNKRKSGSGGARATYLKTNFGLGPCEILNFGQWRLPTANRNSAPLGLTCPSSLCPHSSVVGEARVATRQAPKDGSSTDRRVLIRLTNPVTPEPQGSSPHSQQPPNGPYPEPAESTPHTPPSQSP